MVTRPVITSMAHTIRLHWRRVVAVTWGWRHCKSATISTIGVLRCGVGVVVLHNATLHDNGPPYLIFGEGIASLEDVFYVYSPTREGDILDSPPYTFFLLNGDMELYRNKHFFI